MKKIKRKTLILNKEKGGINMLDIHCKNKALKAAWLRKLNKSGPNKSFVNMYLNKKGLDIEYLIKCSATSPELIKESLKLPTFWAQVFAYYNECKTLKDKKHMNNSDFLAEPIWLNKRFYIKGKPKKVASYM